MGWSKHWPILLGAAALAVLWFKPSFGMDHGFDYSDPRVQWFASRMIPPRYETSCCGKGDAYAVDRYEMLPNGDIRIWIDDNNGAEIEFPDGTKRPKLNAGEYLVDSMSVNRIEDDEDNPQGHSVLWALANPDGSLSRVWCFVRHPNGV
jgi:hypothetical protein